MNQPEWGYGPSALHWAFISSPVTAAKQMPEHEVNNGHLLRGMGEELHSVCLQLRTQNKSQACSLCRCRVYANPHRQSWPGGWVQRSDPSMLSDSGMTAGSSLHLHALQSVICKLQIIEHTLPMSSDCYGNT